MGQSERVVNARSYMAYEQTSAIFFVVPWEQERKLIIEHVCMHANIAKASRRKGFQRSCQQALPWGGEPRAD